MWKARLSELEFDENELLNVVDAIDSGWITAGERTEIFENEFARLHGTSHAVAVCNGTAALFLALKSLGIGPGDEVLCPSLTFVATAAAIVQCGARPVLVDICSLTDPTMDPLDAEQKITPRTKAILPVHYAGIPAEMHAITRLAEAYGIAIVEDAAHAPGAQFAGKACGSWGEAGCFSFFGNKNITTAEGGMITTSNPELAQRMRSLRSHGMTVTSWDREKGRPADYDVAEFGFNFRLDDIRSALGLAQLRKLEQINKKRQKYAELYTNILSTLEPELILPFASIPELREPAFHIYPVILPSQEERDAMVDLLSERGIQTSIHYKPVHRLSAFADIDPDLSLPITEAFASRELTLPLYPGMMESHIDTVVSAMVQCRLRLVAK